MSGFIGKYEVKADVKGRIFIPSVYRKLLPEADKERVVMRRDADNDCLIIYPQAVWYRKMEALKSTLDEWNPVDQVLLMQFVSEAEWLDIDSQGRILIPRKLMQNLMPDNAEMIFIGMEDRFALWSKAGYEKVKLPQADFASLLKERMMKK